MTVVPGRWSARPDAERDADLVLFLIGARFNKPWQVRSAVPVFLAMPRMLRELSAHPETGFVRGETYLSGLTVLVVQYWRSFDQLTMWARAPEELHLPAWRAFNAAARTSTAVGVFHETYRVGATGSEAVYVDMPVMGLAAATEHVPVERRGQSAARRIDPTAPDEPLVPAD